MAQKDAGEVFTHAMPNRQRDPLPTSAAQRERGVVVRVASVFIFPPVFVLFAFTTLLFVARFNTIL